jgi:4-hydroxy-3-polyprenylbenzoate decarboxylase
VAYYRDLREYLAALEANGKLQRVRARINKDTEMHPLVRLQFRGLEAADRKGWLFERVNDVRGREYDIPVAVGCLASSPQIYAIGMQCSVEEIAERWEQALVHPIPPRLVERGACQEVVHRGARLLERGGLDEFPIPISTPGFDNAPYTSASHVVTRDPQTGLRNFGNYRCMLKAPDRLGVFSYQDMVRHWNRARALGQPLEVAVVIGTTPNLSYTAAGRVPSDQEEYAVAGALAGEPVALLKCVSVDLEVPAHAEIVIEGVIPTDELELEGPFGEYTGYMASRAPMMFINVTAITHRRDPIYNAFVSQYPPSESTVLRAISREAALRKFLAVDHGLKGVLDVALSEEVGAFPLLVVQVDQAQGAQPREILRALVGGGRFLAKTVVVVDEDIDPRDFGQVWHAIGWRAQPPRDVYVAPMILNSLDPSASPPGQDRSQRVFQAASGGALLIDATRKWPYPPVSLPSREYMERAIELWRELDLPPLQLRAPWYGQPGAWWTPEQAEEAELALQGRYYETGERFARQRARATDELGE